MRDAIPSDNDSLLPGLTRLAESLKDSPELNQTEIRNLLRELDIDTSDVDVQPLLRFDPMNYARNFVLDTPTLQIRVLCWAPGQASKVHDHGVSNCGLRVLSGAAVETVYRGTLDRCIPSGTAMLGEGDIRVNAGSHLHRIENAGPAPLVTLHIYSPPLIRVSR